MKITVFCNAGLSSGLIVNQMKKIAPEDDINAYQFTKMKEEAPKADVVLVSPALRFKLKEITPVTDPLGIPSAVIDMRAYGLGDGAAVYKQVQELLAQKKEA